MKMLRWHVNHHQQQQQQQWLSVSLSLSLSQMFDYCLSWRDITALGRWPIAGRPPCLVASLGDGPSTVALPSRRRSLPVETASGRGEPAMPGWGTGPCRPVCGGCRSLFADRTARCWIDIIVASLRRPVAFDCWRGRVPWRCVTHSQTTRYLAVPVSSYYYCCSSCCCN